LGYILQVWIPTTNVYFPFKLYFNSWHSLATRTVITVNSHSNSFTQMELVLLKEYSCVAKLCWESENTTNSAFYLAFQNMLFGSLHRPVNQNILIASEHWNSFIGFCPKLSRSRNELTSKSVLYWNTCFMMSFWIKYTRR
jgi:hypothetical protein